MGTKTHAHETITDDKGRELVVKVENLQKYFGRNHVLKGIDLEVYKGEVLVLIGPSGSGKSTFLRCLNFLEDPTSGEITGRRRARHLRQPRQASSRRTCTRSA